MWLINVPQLHRSFPDHNETASWRPNGQLRELTDIRKRKYRESALAIIAEAELLPEGPCPIAPMMLTVEPATVRHLPDDRVHSFMNLDKREAEGRVKAEYDGLQWGLCEATAHQSSQPQFPRKPPSHIYVKL